MVTMSGYLNESGTEKKLQLYVTFKFQVESIVYKLYRKDVFGKHFDFLTSPDNSVEKKRYASVVSGTLRRLNAKSRKWHFWRN